MMLNWKNIAIFVTRINLMYIKLIGVKYEVL